MRICRIISTCLVVFLLQTTVVYGQEDQPTVPQTEVDTTGMDFDAVVAEGAKAYEKREYDKALAYFQRAYDLQPDPAILFNLGLIADKKGDFDLAIRYFNEFVVAPDIDLDARDEALTRLEQLKRLRELMAKEEKTEEEKKEAEKLETSPPPAEPTVTAGPNYTGPAILLGLGGATLVGAGVMAMLANNKHSDFEDATSIEDKRAAADDGEAFSLTADILFGVGGAVTAAGLVYLIIEISSSGSSDTDDSFTLAPSFQQDGAGLNLMLKF